MRSAEASGGDNFGFLGRFAQSSPVTIAVAGTAFLAASLFVAFDIWDALSAPEPAADFSTRFVATAFELPAVAPAVSPLAGLLTRGGIAYGLAGALTVATLRRRRTIPTATSVDHAGLLATIPFGIACWSASGRLIACNEHYRHCLNADHADVRPGSSYAAAVRRIVQGGYVQLVSEDDNSRILELHREDGSCLMIDERPLPGGGFVTLVTDVTESRRTDNLLSAVREEQRILARRYHEEKLRAEAASRSKTAFLAHLSHDIRTPLNHIIGFAEMMRHETFGPLGDERYVEYAETIRTSGQRLLTFFASTLDLAELEGGSRALNPVDVPVDGLIEAVVQKFKALAHRKGINLAIRVTCDTIVTADRYSLERMLSNLVDNAIRYTQSRGRVDVAAHAASDGVVIEITDNGIGMSPERLASVSQPFGFGDATLARDRDGAGLGLAIARTIIELSGGHLAIDSRPGLGTTVAISLPRTQVRSAADVAA